MVKNTSSELSDLIDRQTYSLDNDTGLTDNLWCTTAIIASCDAIEKVANYLKSNFPGALGMVVESSAVGIGFGLSARLMNVRQLAKTATAEKKQFLQLVSIK